MIKLTAKAFINTRTAPATTVIGSKTANTAKGVKLGQTELNTKAATKMGRKTEKGNLCSRTLAYTPGSFSKMRFKAMVSIAGPTGKLMMESGCATKCTGRAS